MVDDGPAAVPGPRLVGRADELTTGRRLVHDVVANGLRVLLVEGSGGMGKSRLLAEVLEQSRPDIGLTVSSRARRASQAPFTAAYPLLRALFGQDQGGAVAEELLQLRGAGGHPTDQHATRLTADAGSDRVRLLADVAAATADALARQADERAAVLHLDDLQWFDASSQELLALVVGDLHERHPHARVLVVGATRPTPAGAMPGDLARALAASARVERLFLGPLAEQEEADLVRSVVSDASVPYVDLVRRSSRGNPLQSLAVIAILQRRGVPGAVRASDPRVARAAVMSVPNQAGDDDGPLRQLLRQVGPGAANVLGRMALFSTEFSVEDAATVTERATEEVEALLDRAVGDLVLESDGLTYWFTHDRLAEVAAAELPPSARLSTHRRSAERLRERARSASRPGSAADDGTLAVEIARHQLLAGESGPVEQRRRDLVTAGNACHNRGAWEDAAHFFESAITLGAGPDAEQLSLHLRAGLAHYYRQDVPSARHRLSEAVDMARRLGDHVTWCEAAMALVRMANTIRTGLPAERPDLSPLEELLEATDDPRLRAEALVVIAEVHNTMGSLAEARQVTQDAVTVAATIGDPAVEAMANFAQGFALLTSNEVRDAERSLRRALDLAREAGDWYIEANLELRLAFALLATGHLAEAERLSNDALRVGQARSDHIVLALGWAINAQLAWLRGDFDEVERAARRAAAATRRSSYGLAAFFYLSAQFLARLATRRFDEAHALLAENSDVWGLAPRLGPVVEAARGEPPPIDQSRRLPVARTQLQAAMVLAATETALVQRHEAALDHLERQLGLLVDNGVRYLEFYPVSIPRLRGEALRVLGRPDEAGRWLAFAADSAEQAGALVEVVPAALGMAQVEMVRPGAPIESARQWAMRAAVTAHRLGLAASAGQAEAIARLGLHLPDAVSARGGSWRAIVVTDVVGSSRVSAEIGDIAYYDLIMRHHDLVRSQLARFGGHEFSESGDGLLIWFDDTSAAVHTALAVRDAVRGMPAGGPRLEVKIGLAGGEPLFHDGRPYGLVVNRAARLVALAQGGEVVCDEAVARSLPDGVTALARPDVVLRNMGEHRIFELR